MKAIRRNVDRMLVILPLKDFYRRHCYPVEYVGHPLWMHWLGVRRPIPRLSGGRRGWTAGRKVALLPGSRSQEIRAMLPVMARMAEVYPEYQFVVAATPVQPGELYDRLLLPDR